MVNKVKSSGAVVIDLRGNGGGARETLTALAGSFTDQPYEMAKEVGRDKTEALRVKPQHPKITVPVFVMIDSASASASEMFARDMQVRRRATVIGDTSGGRVNMARIFPENVGGFRFGTEIAVAKVVMENGDELENHGVTPDQFCIPTAQDLHQEKDPCLDRALELARAAASHPAQQPQP
jgi:carboxyl-terminal processing protease